MKQEVVLESPRNYIGDDKKFLCNKHFDYILRNQNKLSKESIVGRIRDLRDLVDRL